MAKVSSKVLAVVASLMLAIGSLAALPASWFLINQPKTPKHLLK